VEARKQNGPKHDNQKLCIKGYLCHREMDLIWM